MSYKTRTLFIQGSIWTGIAVVVFLLLLSVLPLQFALVRMVGVMAMIAVIHYTNSCLINGVFTNGNWNRYLLQVLVLVVVVSAFRLLLENFVFTPETRPDYFRKSYFRFLFFIVTDGMVCFVSSVILYVAYLSNKEKELLQTINAHNEARLQNLQSQINPHFLFNSLNNIYSLVLTGSKKAPDMLLHLTELLRYSVYQKQREQVSVTDEARQIEFLIELFCLRRDEPYNITFDKTIHNSLIAPMILIPLAENCLKHCDFDLNENAYIKLQLYADRNRLVFATENSFNTIQVKNATGGVGLQNIGERLQLIYGNRFSFTTGATENIYKVELSIEWNP